MASREKQNTNKRNDKRKVNLTKLVNGINKDLSENLSLKCYLCKINHRLMGCCSFKDRSIYEHSLLKNINLVLIVFPKIVILKIVSRASCVT